MKIFGECPACGGKLPIRLKDKTQCPDCGAHLESDPKTATAASLVIGGLTFLFYHIDWRLSVVSAVLTSLFALRMIKYRIVDEEND